jgi:hypothetical protein
VYASDLGSVLGLNTTYRDDIASSRFPLMLIKERNNSLLCLGMGVLVGFIYALFADSMALALLS